MRAQQRSLMIVLLLLIFFIAPGVSATPYTPIDKQQIVARWKVAAVNQQQPLTLQQRLEKSAWHIQQGQYAGQANQHYGRARALLAPLFAPHNASQFTNKNATTKSYALYLWARVLQHQHQFALALEHLEQSINFNNNNSAAILLKANVLLSQGNFTRSKQTCTELLGKADLLLTSACILEVMANQNQLTSSYTQLSELMSRRSAADNNAEKQDWLIQLVAELALRLNKFDEAEQWLAKGLAEEQNLAQKPLSFIVLWADVQLALKHTQAVLIQLAAVVEQAEFKDDALLTRLSLAEKSTASLYWQQLLAERIELRLARQDSFHSADLARFYLDIKPNAEQALYWAKINWQQTKLNDDKQLLHRALIMQNTTTLSPDS